MNRIRKNKLKAAGQLFIGFSARIVMIGGIIIFGAHEYVDIFEAWKPIISATALALYFSYLIIDGRSMEGEI